MSSQQASIALGVMVTLFLLLAPREALGASKSIRTPVFGVLTGDRYSGCMMQIGRIPADSGLNCGDSSDRTWLTLDCSGGRMARSEADRNLRQAQTALLTGTKVTVTVDDSFKAEKFCLGKQIILFR